MAGLLNNASVAAAIGAFCATVGAVATVFITDWIRSSQRARRTLRARVELARDLAVNRRIAIRERGPSPPNSINLIVASAVFDVESVKKLLDECFDQLTVQQRRAIGNLIGAMEHADRLNATALEFQVANRSRSSLEAPINIIDAENVMREALMWLDRAANLCEAFLCKTLSKIGGIPEK